MEKKRLIVGLTEGVTPSKILLDNSLLTKIRFQRIHSINDIITEFKENNSELSNSYNNDELLFQEEIFFKLDGYERKLYTSYVSDELDLEKFHDIYELLTNNEYVEYVQIEEENELTESGPQDPYYNQQWGMSRINCEQAWSYSKGDDIIVAVVDTGIDYNNDDIEPNLWKDKNGFYGYDFAKKDNNTMDYNGHGTHVAGIIGAVHNNQQIAGVAPKSKIMSIKIFPKAYDSVCARGIKYAVDNGAKIISNSWGPKGRRSSNRIVEDAINYAYSKRVICVFAAGNDNDDVKYYAPANHPNVIAVGAIKEGDQRATYSNYGEKVRVCAPGSSILSLRKGSSNPTNKSGTSMAAPFVSGTIALIYSINPNTTSTDILLKKIFDNSNDINTDKPIGRLLDAGKIVYNDPSNYILFERDFYHKHNGVRRCSSGYQNRAKRIASSWHNKILSENPNFKMIDNGIGHIETDHDSGRTWDNARWCWHKIWFRSHILLQKK